nr:replication protein A 70 kDa DNA-binding subunit [Tanacetum cinerariifolium]
MWEKACDRPWFIGSCNVKENVGSNNGRIEGDDKLWYIDIRDYDYSCEHCKARFGHGERLKGYSNDHKVRYHRSCGGGKVVLEPKTFGRHLEEIRVTWTQFWKKRDKIATLLEDDKDVAYSSWRRCESLSESWTRFKDLLQKVSHHEDLALYDNESWNDPRDFGKPVKEIYLPQDVLSTSNRRLIEPKNQVQRLIEAHLAPKSSIQVIKIDSSCAICSGPHDTQYCMKNLEQAFVEYASSCNNKVGGESSSYGFLEGGKRMVNACFLLQEDVGVRDVCSANLSHKVD